MSRNSLPIAVFAGWLMASGCQLAGAANLFADLEAGVFYDDNVGRAERSRDREGDAGLEIFGRAGNMVTPGEGTALTFAASLRLTQYNSLDDLSEISPGVSVSLKHKFGLGAQAPWVSAGIAVERIESESEIRDSWLHAATLAAGRRFGERWNVAAGLRYEIRNGDDDVQRNDTIAPGPPPGPAPAPGPAVTADGDVFDHQVPEFNLSVDYLWSDAVLLLASYRYRDGDIVSSTVSYDRILVNAEAFTQDKAFGNNTFAYRLDAGTHVLHFALNYALSESTSIDLGYEYQSSNADGGIDYDKSVTRLRLLYSY